MKTPTYLTPNVADLFLITAMSIITIVVLSFLFTALKNPENPSALYKKEKEECQQYKLTPINQLPAMCIKHFRQ